MHVPRCCGIDAATWSLNTGLLLFHGLHTVVNVNTIHVCNTNDVNAYPEQLVEPSHDSHDLHVRECCRTWASVPH